MAGLAASRLIVLPSGALGLVIAVFAGFFLYIGASELLPESHHRHPRAWTTVSTVLGVALIWAVVRLSRTGGLRCKSSTGVPSPRFGMHHEIQNPVAPSAPFGWVRGLWFAPIGRSPPDWELVWRSGANRPP
jgi:hypothetical protein